MNLSNRRMGGCACRALAACAARLHAVCAALLLAACASAPDHFYTLNTLPDAPRAALSAPTIHVRLTVTVPRVVDRSEMVVSTSATGIVILDHERWAAPLADQVVQTLARDLERRRDDILVGERDLEQASSPPVRVRVDIVHMSAQRGGRATIEAHWRIVDTLAGVDEVGSDAFEASSNGDGYAAVAQAYSRALSALADELVHAVHRR